MNEPGHAVRAATHPALAQGRRHARATVRLAAGGEHRRDGATEGLIFLPPLTPLVGRSGWLSAMFASISTLAVEEHILFAAVTDDGPPLDPDQCQRPFGLPAEEQLLISVPDPGVPATLAAAIDAQHALLLPRLDTKNTSHFDQELEKLDRWDGDRRSTLRLALRERRPRGGQAALGPGGAGHAHRRHRTARGEAAPVV